jgi:hypothetical protein
MVEEPVVGLGLKVALAPEALNWTAPAKPLIGLTVT